MERVLENETTETTEIKMVYHCPKCQIGHLTWTHLVLKGEVDKYMHKCDNLVCCHKEMLTDKYE